MVVKRYYILFLVIPENLGKNITQLSNVITRLTGKLSNEFSTATKDAEYVEKSVKSEPSNILKN